jgi:hypothetical protein
LGNQLLPQINQLLNRDDESFSSLDLIGEFFFQVRQYILDVLAGVDGTGALDGL